MKITNHKKEIEKARKREFYKIYHEKIKPILADMEVERKNLLSGACIQTCIWSAAAIFLVLVYIQFAQTNNQILLSIISVCAVISFMATVWVIPFINSQFVRRLKSKCYKKLLKVWTGLAPYSGSDDNGYEESKLFAEYNEINYYDQFWGHIDDIGVSIQEVMLYLAEGNRKGAYFVPVFKGIVTRIDGNKSINGVTIVTRKGDFGIKHADLSLLSVLLLPLISIPFIFPRVSGFWCGVCAFLAFIPIIILPFKIEKLLSKDYWLGKRARKQKVSYEGKNLQKVKLEDTEFNREFSVYSTDQIEGRYLVTPAFMERFRNIQTAFGTKNVKCSFYDNKLMFAISTWRNAFEIGNLFTPLDNPKHMEGFYNEFSSILALIDYFKLDERTGL